MSIAPMTHLPPFTAKNGAVLYPVHLAAAYGDRDGGTIYVYDGQPPSDVQRLGFPHEDATVVGELTWNRKTIQFVAVGSDASGPWERQGIATHMWTLAREIEPRLRHAPCHERSTDEGEAFVRATSPQEACNNACVPECRHRGPAPETAPVRPLTMWERITRALRR